MQKLIEGTLATAGGFLIGYILVAILGWWCDKYLFKRKSPELLHRFCRVLGGLILAIIVALMVFGGGGGNGNGAGDGTGNGKASPTNGTIDPNESADPKRVPTKALPPAEEHVRITVLGGTDVKDQKFYLMDDEPTPRALADIKSAIQKKKESTTRTLGVEIRFSLQNALPQDHPAVTQLTRWARETAVLTVTFPAEAP